MHLGPSRPLALLALLCLLSSSCTDDETSDEGTTNRPPATSSVTASSETTSSPSNPTSSTSADTSSPTTGDPTTGDPTTGSADSSSGGGLVCDGSGDCTKCETCERNLNCAIEFSTCAVDPDCGMLIACIMACDPEDDPCKQACLAGSAGAGFYLPYAQCVFCQQCVMDCDPFDPGICG